MPMTAQELTELISNQIDPDLFIEILDLSTEDLVHKFMDEVIEHSSVIEQYLEGI